MNTINYELPAGRYFVGDPYYFLNDLTPFVNEGRGVDFILWPVNKNCVLESLQSSYSIQSGYFGLVSVSLGDMRNYTGDGTFHEFKSPVKCICNKGFYELKSTSDSITFENVEESCSVYDGYDSYG